MNSYFFIHYTLHVIKTGEVIPHSTVIATSTKFFPLNRTRKRLIDVFTKDVGGEVGITIHSFKEVPKECYDECHSEFESYADLD